MPFHAAPAPAHARQDPPRRLPALRLVLLGSLGAGLLGLAVPAAQSAAAPAAHPRTAASRLSLEPPVPRQSQLNALAARRSLLAASRSRAAAPRAVVTPAVPVAPQWVRPVAAPVNSPFGRRWGRPHLGDDFAATTGSEIHAIGDGVVVGAGYLPDEGGYGQITLIQHAGGITSAYAHQSRMLVHAGDHVTVGQVIGYVGSTGHVTGPHLHFEIRTATHGGQIDPRTWLRAHGVTV